MSPRTPVIDFHAHILPAADHGSSGIAETKAQLALYRKAGVDTVVATPHFYPNSVSIDDFLSTVNSAAAELTELLHRESDPTNPRILVGAEVLYCDNLHHMADIEKLCLRGTNVLLLELPLSDWSPTLFHTVRELSKRFSVVLAHVDRYFRPHFDNLLALVQDGALVQINAHSFSFFERRLAPFLNAGVVVALGSDLHHTDSSAVKKLVGAKKRLGEDYNEIMRRSMELLKDAESIS